ncbi:glycosyltransferase family 4 protein [Candidatus Nitrotoga arctica]|uniref:Glycosyltransferase involved in cell wall bisynthesis n=1 Tax=Candidatus Nitrotoga arctica TaxID=453162 RepID=A0ABN8AT34_9PROT|nr:glycosyltransferase family 4 protein [Candidatus Nitrotoga arctica]CAG9933555.1 Glycosyltransferase involved in cell wall bisynthesis [Candidatus Nitrotoga arctica]
MVWVPEPEIYTMKILLTTHVFLPDYFGGTETLVLGVALALKQRGHNVTVVTGYPEKDKPGDINQFDEYEVDSIRVIRFRHGRTALGDQSSVMQNDYDNPVFAHRFRQLLLEIEPDVVHFHHLERLSIKAIDACKDRKIPAFLTATDFWYVCPAHTLLLPNGNMCDGPANGGANCLKHLTSISQPKWVAGILNSIPTGVVEGIVYALKRTNAKLSGRFGDVQALARRSEIIGARLPLLERIFVATTHAQRMIETAGIIGGKFRVLPFGIKDHGYVKRIRQRTDRPLVLGFIGSMLPHKGLHILVEASKLLPADAAVKIKIYGKSPVGDSAYIKDLRVLAQGDERIKFYGTFENEKMPAILDGIDALVIPSLWHENMPLVSLSAQAAGCPLIASDIGGLSDVVDPGKNGLLFSPGSASGLAQMIMCLLDDHDLLKKLSGAAVRPMDINQYVDELELEYRKSIGEMDLMVCL